MSLERAAERGHARLKNLPSADLAALAAASPRSATPAAAGTLVILATEAGDDTEVITGEEHGAQRPSMFSLLDTFSHLPTHLASKSPAV